MFLEFKKNKVGRLENNVNIAIVKENNHGNLFPV